VKPLTLAAEDTKTVDRKKRNATIADIAHIAGVSTATVSRVLADSPKVTADTRERVKQVISDLDYEPNQLARSLTTARTANIAVVVQDIANPFFVEVALGVETVLRDAGYSMFLTSSAWDPEKEEELIRKLVRNRVDGIIFAPIEPEGQTVGLLKRRGIPFVLVNAQSADPEVSWVNTDNFRGGYLAAQALAATHAHTLVSLLGFPHQTSRTRRDGFAAGVQELKGRQSLEYRPLEQVYAFEDGYECVPELIAAERIHEVPTGIFALNDDVALGVVASLIDHGISVPGQVSVVGYDDIPSAKRYQVPLTTIAQPKRQMGELAARALLHMLRNPEAGATQRELLPRLVQRSSTMPVRPERGRRSATAQPGPADGTSENGASTNGVDHGAETRDI
jgi:DNA-binding LacI/PurR family transcriptional regulator